MTNLEQSKRLKESGFMLPDVENIYINYGNRRELVKRVGALTQNNVSQIKDIIHAPSETELMGWLAKNTESGIILCSEITEDDLPYWELTAYAKYEDIEVKHADLTECLVMAVEAVLKGAK